MSLLHSHKLPFSSRLPEKFLNCLYSIKFFLTSAPNYKPQIYPFLKICVCVCADCVCNTCVCVCVSMEGKGHVSPSTVFKSESLSVLFSLVYSRLAQATEISRDPHISACHLLTGSLVLQAQMSMPRFSCVLRIWIRYLKNTSFTHWAISVASHKDPDI